jgi:hypothetical protein
LLADPRTPEAARARLKKLQARLDPVSLLHEIRDRQRRLVEIADQAATEERQPASLDEFLAALKTAWQDGMPRPTEQQAAPKVRWWRSRKDPFETTWAEVQRWAEAEPEQTARQLFQRLQAEYPSTHSDGQLRTLQRRLKAWRREMACDLAFESLSNEAAQPKTMATRAAIVNEAADAAGSTGPER